MNFVEKIKAKRRLANSILNYLIELEKESKEECAMKLNRSDWSMSFKSSFNGQEVAYRIEKEEFFEVCEDAKSSEEVKEKIDALGVQKYYESIIKLRN